jgi:hypothetical protein
VGLRLIIKKETMDVELRYHDDEEGEGQAKIDIGVFAPGNRMTVEEGEWFVKGFRGYF